MKHEGITINLEKVVNFEEGGGTQDVLHLYFHVHIVSILINNNLV